MSPDLRPPPPRPFRLIIDPPAAGSWNMAVDEALLAAATDEGIATLRLYAWDEPTLSLGYFQPHDDRLAHRASHECPVVRRSSGGGAILHDRELTYSLTLPAGHRSAHDAASLYTVVHRALVDVLTAELSLASTAWDLSVHCPESQPEAGSAVSSESEPFLCFARRSPGDVLLVGREDATTADQNWKIVGSAQRRRGGAVLQHGSVLLGRSPTAPELPGCRELTGSKVSFSELSKNFPHRLAASLNTVFEPAKLPAAICDVARQIERTKFQAREWTKKR